MMSKQAPIQSSSFSIRFKPAFVEHEEDLDIADDECSVSDRSPSRNGSREAVLFERVSNTDELEVPSLSVESSPVTHPSNLCKNSQAVLSRSAPVSELTSPVSPLSAGTLPVTHEKPTAVKPLSSSQPLTEKLSIFSGLKEKLDKLSTESKEIFDRKMKRSGSADAAKIASLLVADPDVTKLNATKNETTDENTGTTAPVEKSHNNVGETGEQNLQVTEHSEQSAEGDSADSASSSKYIRKSTSSFEVMKTDIVSTSAAKPKRSSLGGECSEQPVVMSRLLSSTNQPDSRPYVDNGANISPSSESSRALIRDTHHSTNTSLFRKATGLISSARFRYLFSFVVAVFAYAVIPMPTYVSGMLVGAFLSAIGILSYQRLTRSRPAAAVPSHVARSLTPITADIRESKNAEEKFQVRKSLDTTMCMRIGYSDCGRPVTSLSFCSLINSPLFLLLIV